MNRGPYCQATKVPELGLIFLSGSLGFNPKTMKSVLLIIYLDIANFNSNRLVEGGVEAQAVRSLPTCRDKKIFH